MQGLRGGRKSKDGNAYHTSFGLGVADVDNSLSWKEFNRPVKKFGNKYSTQKKVMAYDHAKKAVTHVRDHFELPSLQKGILRFSGKLIRNNANLNSVKHRLKGDLSLKNMHGMKAQTPLEKNAQGSFPKNNNTRANNMKTRKHANKIRKQK